MENENIELENVSEDTTQEIFTGPDLQSDPVEISEDVQQVPEEVPEETQPVLEELLKELIEQKINEGENEEQEQSADNINNTDGGDISILSDTNTVDYTQVLNDLLGYSEDILLSVNTVNDNYDTYIANNDINADINNISLSNYLLLLVFIALLFNAVLNFARRIF